MIMTIAFKIKDENRHPAIEHPRAGGDPQPTTTWIPTFVGMLKTGYKG
jgi:hypothetical protein